MIPLIQHPIMPKKKYIHDSLFIKNIFDKEAGTTEISCKFRKGSGLSVQLILT